MSRFESINSNFVISYYHLAYQLLHCSYCKAVTAYQLFESSYSSLLCIPGMFQFLCLNLRRMLSYMPIYTKIKVMNAPQHTSELAILTVYQTNQLLCHTTVTILIYSVNFEIYHAVHDNSTFPLHISHKHFASSRYNAIRAYKQSSI